MKKRKLFDILNVLTTLKGYVASLISGIPLAIIVYLRMIAQEQATRMILNILGLGCLLFQLFFWGYLVRRWWKWQ